jgi:TetR/AcrR family transcriptional regulator
MTVQSEIETKIIEAARIEFEQKGYSGARMQEIANAAGICKASLHYHFRSKEKLFQTIFDHALESYIPLLNTWLDDTLSWEEKTTQFTDKLFEFTEKGALLFIIREINRDPGLIEERIKKKKTPNRFVAYFEKLQSDGVIKSVDAKFLYIFLNSICCFPVINKTVFQRSLRLSDSQYSALMKQYTSAAAALFISAIKKNEF